MKINLDNTYSIILPTYNEVGHIQNLIQDIHNIFSEKNSNLKLLLSMMDLKMMLYKKFLNSIKNNNIMQINRMKKNILLEVQHTFYLKNLG